jgi:hypothetical protein
MADARQQIAFTGLRNFGTSRRSLRRKLEMDVRCTSTGKIFYEVSSQLAALLIEALPTVFEKVERSAPEKKRGSARFTLERSLTGGEPHIRYACDACNQSGVLLNPCPTGGPGRSAAKHAEDAARSFFFWHCGKKEVLPEALIQQFKQAF